MGDFVFARPEFSPLAPLRPQQIEEVFVRKAQVISISAGGQTIETTTEHPCWVDGKGWVPVLELVAGDLLVGHDGTLTQISAVIGTGRIETVYNFRVSQDHTYFVGDPNWGFTVWVHNSYRVDGAGNVLDDAGNQVGKIETNPDGSATYKSNDGNTEYNYDSYEDAANDVGNGFASNLPNGNGTLNKPAWVRDARTFVSWIKQFESPNTLLSTAEINQLVSEARRYGVSVTASASDLAGHPGTNWPIPHIHFGDARIHIAVPAGYRIP